MADSNEATPGWVWVLGAVLILALVLGLLRIISWVFSLPVLLLALIGVGGYLWYRSNQKSSA